VRRFTATSIRFARAWLTNQIARFAPAYYVRMTGQTGRGESAAETVNDISEYFHRCFTDYFAALGVPTDAIGSWLRDKVLLEYGPGDLPGVAMLMVAHGAEKVYCVDRFSLLALSSKNVAAIEALLDRLQPQERLRASECFVEAGNLRSGFAPRRIEYLIRENGLSKLDNRVDFVFSRSVLEHVNSLADTLADMELALRSGGSAVHRVDLRSHGLHRDNPLDFLNWPAWMWNCMFSKKGVPNRWRIDRYRELLGRTGLEVTSLTPTHRADPRDIAEVRPRLARPFRKLSDEELSWLGFWLVCRKPPVQPS